MKPLAILCVCVGVTFVAAADDDAAKADLDKLQGAWKLITVESDGKKVPEEVVKTMRLTVMGDKLVLREDNKNEEGTIKLDPTKKPSAMDLSIKAGDKMETVRLIYSVVGDDLKLCGGKVGKDRPTEFGAKTGSGLVLFVLKREKE